MNSLTNNSINTAQSTLGGLFAVPEGANIEAENDAPSELDGTRRLRGADTIEARFWEFHANNPHIYDLLVRFAREAKTKGRRAHYGIAAIFERVRWHVHVETQSDDDLKLNNDFRAHYARLIMEQEPDLAGFFATRELRAA